MINVTFTFVVSVSLSSFYLVWTSCNWIEYWLWLFFSISACPYVCFLQYYLSCSMY